MATTKFSQRKQAAFLELLRDGGRRAMSARAVGVDPRTVQRFMAANPDFVEQVDRAEIEANEAVEDALFQAAVSGNVTACQTWLYNRDPESWRDTRNVRVAGHGGGPVEYEERGELARAIIGDPDARERAQALLALVVAGDGARDGDGPGPAGDAGQSRSMASG